MEFLKSVVVAVWDRVVVNYKPTLIGLALAIGILFADMLAQYLGAQPQVWAQPLAALVAMIGAALRSRQGKYPAPVQPPPAS